MPTPQLIVSSDRSGLSCGSKIFALFLRNWLDLYHPNCNSVQYSCDPNCNNGIRVVDSRWSDVVSFDRMQSGAKLSSVRGDWSHIRHARSTAFSFIPILLYCARSAANEKNIAAMPRPHACKITSIKRQLHLTRQNLTLQLL